MQHNISDSCIVYPLIPTEKCKIILKSPPRYRNLSKKYDHLYPHMHTKTCMPCLQKRYRNQECEICRSKLEPIDNSPDWSFICIWLACTESDRNRRHEGLVVGCDSKSCESLADTSASFQYGIRARTQEPECPA